jgi:hypothetical protein
MDEVTIKPGIYKGMSNAEYHAVPALNNSGIKQLLISPAHYKAQKEGQPTDLFDKTQAKFTFGSAFHASILEPEVYEKEVAIIPEEKTGKNAESWKMFKDKCRKEKLMPITGNEKETIIKMTESINRHKLASKIIRSSAEKELSIFWNDPEYGFLCKIRVDFFSPIYRLIGDLKSTVDASEDGFRKSFYHFGYNIQAPWYFDAFKLYGDKSVVEIAFVAVEKTAPYGVNVFTISEDTMQKGRDKIDYARAIYAKCLDTDIWPCYEEKLYKF